jgi:hypothetical protein
MKMAEHYGTLERLTTDQGADASYPRACVNDEARHFPVMRKSEARGMAAVPHEIDPRGRGRPSCPQHVDPHRAILAGLWHQDDLAVGMARSQSGVSLDNPR